jgi:hypothetical protein
MSGGRADSCVNAEGAASAQRGRARQVLISRARGAARSSRPRCPRLRRRRRRVREATARRGSPPSRTVRRRLGRWCRRLGRWCRRLGRWCRRLDRRCRRLGRGRVTTSSPPPGSGSAMTRSRYRVPGRRETGRLETGLRATTVGQTNGCRGSIPAVSTTRGRCTARRRLVRGHLVRRRLVRGSLVRDRPLISPGHVISPGHRTSHGPTNSRPTRRARRSSRREIHARPTGSPPTPIPGSRQSRRDSTRPETHSSRSPAMTGGRRAHSPAIPVRRSRQSSPAPPRLAAPRLAAPRLAVTRLAVTRPLASRSPAHRPRPSPPWFSRHCPRQAGAS